jgi:predicted DCC family thiol-disulfide oxidoreductase YuxK
MSREYLIVFYDGKCPFCIGWTKFLIDRDGYDRLRFADLHGEWAHQFFASHNLKHPGMESVVTWDGGFLARRSAAAITLATALPGVWGMGKHLDLLPARLLDTLYDGIAKNRYRWFGQRDQCWIPKPEDRRKFLDMDPSGHPHSQDGHQSGND